MKLYAGHCWRSRDEPISDVLLWTPTHGRAKAGRPARTYIQQLCEDTGCCPEDLPRAMNDREEWRERVRDIRATRTIWWWYDITVQIISIKNLLDAIIINIVISESLSSGNAYNIDSLDSLSLHLSYWSSLLANFLKSMQCLFRAVFACRPTLLCTCVGIVTCNTILTSALNNARDHMSYIRSLSSYRRFPWLFLSICPYRASAAAVLPNYILYLHGADVNNFLLVGQQWHIHYTT